MLTKDQKIKRLEIQQASYKLQTLTSKTLDENVKLDAPNFGETKKEIRTNLQEYTSIIRNEVNLPSSSLFNSSELSILTTVISGSILYGT